MFSILSKEKENRHKKALDMLSENAKVAKSLKKKLSDSVDLAVVEFEKELKGNKNGKSSKRTDR